MEGCTAAPPDLMPSCIMPVALKSQHSSRMNKHLFEPHYVNLASIEPCASGSLKQLEARDTACIAAITSHLGLPGCHPSITASCAESTIKTDVFARMVQCIGLVVYMSLFMTRVVQTFRLLGSLALEALGQSSGGGLRGGTSGLSARKGQENGQKRILANVRACPEVFFKRLKYPAHDVALCLSCSQATV
jgi:hypothetical protein